MDAFLHFFMGHLQQIIMWLFIFFFTTSIIYFVYSAFFKKLSSAGIGAQSEEIEALLKKVLAQTEGIPRSASSSDNPKSIDQVKVVTGSGSLPSDSALKIELDKKQAEIEKLKKEVVDIKASPASADNSAELLKKIKDLEARLAEYEIIEDDIADLSKYKEENAKLRAELEKVAKGGTASIPEETSAVPAEAPAAEPTEALNEDLITEFQQAVSDQAVASTSGPDLAEKVGDEVEIEDPGDVSELVKATEAAAKQAPAAPVAAAPAVTAPTPTATAPAATGEVKDQQQDDILGEFVEAGVDTDKMMAEMTGLAEAGTATDTEALDGELDIEKMAGEASSLEKN